MKGKYLCGWYSVCGDSLANYTWAIMINTYIEHMHAQYSVLMNIHEATCS